jgi:hypothetical protein
MSEQTPTAEKPRPSDRLNNIKIGGETVDFFMSFAMLNDFVKLTGVVENAPLILLDHELREKTLSIALKRRFKTKLAGADVNLDDFEMSAEDAEKICVWISEHVLDFFMRSIRRIGDMGAENLKALQSLQGQMVPPSSPDGSTPSPSQTPAAGPST